MKIDRTTLLFFDASCLVAAAGSPTGGSGFLLRLCEHGFLRAAVSQPVLLEAQRNVAANMGERQRANLARLLTNTPWLVVPVPADKALERCAGVVGQKDAHVLAAALAAGAPLLVCLDKPLRDRVNRADVPLRASSPGDFITQLLPSHPDYPEIR